MPTRERYLKNAGKYREEARRRYHENRDKELARGRKWREDNLELKRRIMKESARRRRADKPQLTRAIQKKARQNETPERRANRLLKISEWHKTHRPEMREYFRIYNQEQRDAEKERVRSTNRRAWYRGAIGKFTASDVQSLYEKQNGKCNECGYAFPKTGKHRFEVDHIIPLKPRGASKPVGTNHPKNLQLLCRACNRSKSNRIIE